MILFPKDVSTVTKEAILLWLNSIVPALFPFFIVSGIIRKSGLLQVVSYKKLPFIMGFFSGYPVGAQMACEYLKKKLICEEDFYKIVSYSMVTGPAFLIGSCGVDFFGSQHIGYCFAFSHYFAALIIWFCYGRKVNGCRTCLPVHERSKREQNILKYSIKSAIDSIFTVLGYLIIFMILTCMMKKSGIFLIINNDCVTALTTGIMEMTIGTRAASMLDNPLVSVTAASFIISFGGLCVIGQTISIMDGIEVNVMKIIAFKIIHGIISVFLCLILMILW